MTRVAVLGAGPAGLGAALDLARRGIEVVLLERGAGVGGNAGSFELAGQRVDFGSHRLHPASDPAVLADLRGLLAEDLLTRPRHGRIRLMGRWLHFPLRPLDLALRVPPAFALGVAADLARKALPARRAEQETFASVLQRGLGRTICREFYFPYARKIWGLAPEQLSAAQARKRVSSGSIGKLLRRLLPGGRGGAGTKGIFYYPRHGYGQICNALLQAAEAAGAHVHLRAKVLGVTLGGETQRVAFQLEGGSELEDGRNDSTQELVAEHVWSTIPITALARLVTPRAPQPVLDAARSLRFRSMLLVYLVLEQDRFTEYDAHYFPGAELKITRLSEPKNYAAQDTPEGSTVLCAELPCSREEPVFGLSDEALAALVCRDLERAGLPVRARIRQVAVRRLAQAYPLYPEGWERHFQALDSWLRSLPGLLSFGRQGLYAHDNTHHALYMAKAAARCLADDGRFDHAAWEHERRIFETHVVED